MAGRFVVAITLCAAACSAHPSDAGSIDATDVSRVDDDAPVGHSFTYDFGVTDELGQPLADAAVRAERRGRDFETTTGDDGYAHLVLDDVAPWDLTAAVPGRSAVSLLGVDATSSASVPNVMSRVGALPTEVPVAGHFENQAPGAQVDVQISGGSFVRVNGNTFDGAYLLDPDSMLIEGDVRVAATAYDVTGRPLDRAMVVLPRDGTAHRDVTLRFPDVAPPIERTTTAVTFPASGVFSRRNSFPSFGASALQHFGFNNYVAIGAASDPPYEGTAFANFETFGGPLAADAFVVYGTVVFSHSIAFQLVHDHADAPFALPVLDELRVDGESLDTVQFSASGRGYALLGFLLLSDEAGGALWSGQFAHPERAVYRQLPHLPSSVSIAAIAPVISATMQLAAVSDPLHPEDLAHTMWGFFAADRRPVSLEGR